MRIVAVSQRVDVNGARNERRDAVDQRLMQWLARAGYAPVPVPNAFAISAPTDHAGNATLMSWLEAVQPGAIVLSGGNDIGEAPERDATETALLNFAQHHGLPVLGICRGMQMMAVSAGGKLIPIRGHAGTRHVLSGETTDEVNSYHNYALESCPPGYVVGATSADGCIEAIRHQQRGWEGWMWHPEREPRYAPQDIKRLKQLFGE